MVKKGYTTGLPGVFISLSVLLICFTIWSFLVSQSSKTVYKECDGNLCNVAKAVYKNPKNVSSNTWYIAKNNVIAEFKVVSSKYFLISPILDLYLVGSSLGKSFRNNYLETISKVIIPHGLIELTAVILTLSLYYCLIVVLFKSVFTAKSFKWIFQKLAFQIVLILALFVVSGFLEAMLIYFRGGLQ